MDTKIRIKKNPKLTTTKSQAQNRQENQLNFTVKFPNPTSRVVRNAVCQTDFGRIFRHFLVSGVSSTGFVLQNYDKFRGYLL